MLQNTIEYCATFRYCKAVVEDPYTEFLNERQWWIEDIENSFRVTNHNPPITNN